MLRRLTVVLACVVIAAATAVMAVPAWRERAESIPLRVEAWWHDLQPRDPYVPPPPPQPASGVARSEPTETAAPSATPPTHRTPAPEAPPPTATIPPPTPPAEMRLANFRHEYQGWNNCGPATVGMLLSHYGFADTQKEIAPLLKPNARDRNVAPEELASYIRTKPGFGALVAVSGDLTVLKRLIALDLPVIAETWFTPKPNDGMGHYRLLFAHSDSRNQFTALDSYNGANVKLDYAEFDDNWKAFGRLYIVAYRREREEQVRALTGYASTPLMWRQAETRAREEIGRNVDDAYAWFNLGTALSHQSRHRDAASAFDRARLVGLPWRMLWYQFEIYDSYLAVDRAQEVLDLVDLTISQTGELEEAHYYRGQALERLGQTADAQRSYREAVRLNPNYRSAAAALARLGG